MNKHPYKKLAISLAISFIIMYIVMFLNVSQRDHIYVSLTRTYMTLLMVSAMAITMIMVMNSMYSHKQLNGKIIGISMVVFIVSLMALRNQRWIWDIQYMQAMIPHHSSAILTSSHAQLRDPQVRQLANEIIIAQEKEISQMKQLISQLK